MASTTRSSATSASPRCRRRPSCARCIRSASRRSSPTATRCWPSWAPSSNTCRDLRRRPVHAGSRHAGAAALHLLHALRRRLADAASVHEAGVRPHARARAVLHAAGGARHLERRRQDAARCRRSATTSCSSRASSAARVVRRPRVHRRRHPDELPARSRHRALADLRAGCRSSRPSSTASRPVPPTSAPWKRAGAYDAARSRRRNRGRARPSPTRRQTSKERNDGPSRPAARQPLDPGGRRAAVHRVQSRPGDRAVQGGHRRLLPGAERAAEGTARGVAEAHHRRARRVQGQASREEGGALRGQPDRAQLQRPPAARRRHLREVQGADPDHLAARARRRRASRPIATAAWCSTT